MKRIFICLTALLCSLSVAQAQKEFMGTVSYAYEVEGENAEMMKMMMPEKMIVKYSKHGMITYMEGGLTANMMGKIVVNTDNQESFIVKDDKKVVYLMSEEERQDAEVPETKANKIEGETQKILGYTCQKYELIVDQEGEKTTQYIWAAQDLKAPQLNMPGANQLSNGMFFGGEVQGFPLLIEIGMPEVEATLTMKAIELDDTPVNAKEFKRPADYETKDFSEFSVGGF